MLQAPKRRERQFRNEASINASQSGDDLQLFQPAQEEMGGGIGFLAAARTLKRMQNFVALIDAGARLVLADERRRIFDVANDAPVDEPELRSENELLHGRITGALGGCSDPSATRPRVA